MRDIHDPLIDAQYSAQQAYHNVAKKATTGAAKFVSLRVYGRPKSMKSNKRLIAGTAWRDRSIESGILNNSSMLGEDVGDGLAAALGRIRLGKR
jgi:hypothetical protein